MREANKYALSRGKGWPKAYCCPHVQIPRPPRPAETAGEWRALWSRIELEASRVNQITLPPYKVAPNYPFAGATFQALLLLKIPQNKFTENNFRGQFNN